MSQVDAWISAEFQNLAEVINDYDEHLFLEMVPLNQIDKLTDKSKVFRIIDDRTNKIVLYADSLANPKEILTRLWSMDVTKGDVITRLDIANNAAKALDLRKQIDEREAQKDLAAFVIKNTKSRWEHEGKIYDDEMRDLGPKQVVID